MVLGRRAFLKLAGGALVTGGGYTGYEEVNGGSWLFDPATLTAAHSKYFAFVDYSTLYQAVEEHSDASLESLDTAAGELDPEDLDEAAAVGSVSISGNNGVPTGVFAGGVSGEFDADTFRDPVEDALDLEAAGSKGGFDLFTMDNPAASTDSSELSMTPETIAGGVQSGGAISGTIRAPEADVESVDAVKRMISAKDGGVGHADYLAGDGDYRQIRRVFDTEPTFLVGTLFDPALVTLSTSLYEVTAGAAGELVPGGGVAADAVSAFIDAWFAELAGGAIGGTIDTDAEETTIQALFTYNTASDAEQTGIVQLVNAASTESDLDDVEVDARYIGRSVVVRLTGDTEALFEQTAEASGPTAVPTTPSGVRETLAAYRQQ